MLPLCACESLGGFYGRYQTVGVSFMYGSEVKQAGILVLSLIMQEEEERSRREIDAKVVVRRVALTAGFALL